MAKKQQKRGAKLKYNTPTMVSSLRHPKSKKKEVKQILSNLKQTYLNEFRK